MHKQLVGENSLLQTNNNIGQNVDFKIEKYLDCGG